MKKNSEIRIKLSTEELEKIKNQSNKAGLSIQQFCLTILLNTEVSIKIVSRNENI